MVERSFESMLKWAAWLITGGLLVQLVTCFWIDPLSFILFLTAGSSLTAAGTLFFLYWLAAGRR